MRCDNPCLCCGQLSFQISLSEFSEVRCLEISRETFFQDLDEAEEENRRIAEAMGKVAKRQADEVAYKALLWYVPSEACNHSFEHTCNLSGDLVQCKKCGYSENYNSKGERWNEAGPLHHYPGRAYHRRQPWQGRAGCAFAALTPALLLFSVSDFST